MRRSGQGSGGGLGMNKVVHRPHGKTEPRSYGKSPGGVSELGNMVGDHVTHRGNSTGFRGESLVRGPGYATPVGVSDPVKAVGVGGGREVMPCGGQGTHGAVNRGNPQPTQGDILSQYGPESKRG